MTSAPETFIHPSSSVLLVAPRLIIRTLFACMVLLVAAGLATQFAVWFFDHDMLLGLVPEFDLDAENNVPTWFSSICLFLCAAELSLIGLLEQSRDARRSRYWFGMGGLFAFLSLDETASLHERLSGPVTSLFHTDGYLRFAWVIPGWVFAVGFVVWIWRFLRLLAPRTQRDFVVAGLIYCSGCLGMEMIGGHYVSHHGKDFSYAMVAILEESLEMTGTILFLRALLAYHAEHAASFAVNVERR